MLRSPTSSTGRAERLAKLARREAGQVAPDFSEVRHARIMRAVEEAAPCRPLHIAPLQTRASRRSWLGPMALAATLALAAAVGLRFFWNDSAAVEAQRVVMAPARLIPALTSGKVETPAAAVNPVALEVDVDAHVPGAVATAMAEQQWAGLDRDVRAATRYLVDQVPLRAAWLSDGAPEER